MIIQVGEVIINFQNVTHVAFDGYHVAYVFLNVPSWIPPTSTPSNGQQYLTFKGQDVINLMSMLNYKPQ